MAAAVRIAMSSSGGKLAPTTSHEPSSNRTNSQKGFTCKQINNKNVKINIETIKNDNINQVTIITSYKRGIYM